MMIAHTGRYEAKGGSVIRRDEGGDVNGPLLKGRAVALWSSPLSVLPFVDAQVEAYVLRVDDA